MEIKIREEIRGRRVYFSVLEPHIIASKLGGIPKKYCCCTA
jgi:hypothetical protein